jgi:argininosuccinate lyase
VTPKLWGGRFEAEPSELLRRLNDSFAFDRELFAEDVEGSIAWARALGHAGVLTSEEAQTIASGLQRIVPPVGQASACPYEDVHTYVESKLYEEIGDLAGKLTPAARATTRWRPTCASG